MAPKTIPIFPTASFDRTKGFYALLGFEEIGRWPDEYQILEHPKGIELHFWFNKSLKPARNDVCCYMRLDDSVSVRELHATWAALGLPDAETKQIPRLHNPDSDGEFALIDINGNLIRISS